MNKDPEAIKEKRLINSIILTKARGKKNTIDTWQTEEKMFQLV